MSDEVKTRNLPNADRLSVLAATILLVYALARLLDVPGRELALQLPGIYLEVQVNIRTLVAVLLAGVTAAGADWLLRDHPKLGNQSTIPHWLLPGMTALVLGAALSQMPPDPTWWIGVAVGGGALMLVLVAEYIVVDPDDVRHPAASALLIAISFALFLALSISLRIAGLRLFLLLPAITIAAGLVSLRTLHLRLHGRWAIIHAGIIALIIGQLAAALHYWPLSPVAFGLILLAPLYGLTIIIVGLIEKVSVFKTITEPLIVMVIVWSVALWLG